jgi:alkanesulfonate monooxygenase SsuD/methylene tetrahydromethanopterin reductase-like flavin-dependent oxidoreductase (luciferase family)
MTMPVMEPDLDATVLENWARGIDEGPFSSLCWGERIAFENPDNLTLLGALAAWTDRVRLLTTVIVPQLHDPVMLAKALATGDLLCGGRLTVGIGVGGRHEDYHAVGADPATQTMRGTAERVAVMKRVWAGEKITESVEPVGPPRSSPGVRRCSSAVSGRRPSAAPRRGPTDWPAPRWTSTSPSRTSCSTWRGRRGRGPAGPNPTC